MKKYRFLIFSIVSILALTACTKRDSYEIKITIPAGSTEEFVYSDEEICPTGSKITILAGAGMADTEVILKPVNEALETGYVAEYLTHGMPVELDAEKGEWFKIGIAMQNDSKEDQTVLVKVEGVEVRIADSDKNDLLKTEPEEWTEDKIRSLFESNADEDWNYIEYVAVDDDAFDRIGVILYTVGDSEKTNVAFMTEDGSMQHCGIEAVLDTPSGFTYLGNGAVTFKVYNKDGIKYTQKITLSIEGTDVNFVSEAIDYE